MTTEKTIKVNKTPRMFGRIPRPWEYKIYFEMTATTDAGFDILFSVKDFIPARPALACSNPDSAAYGDPGDPQEYHVESVLFLYRYHEKDEQHRIPVPAAMAAYLISVFEEDIIAEGEKQIDVLIKEYMEWSAQND